MNSFKKYFSNLYKIQFDKNLILILKIYSKTFYVFLIIIKIHFKIKSRFKILSYFINLVIKLCYHNNMNKIKAPRLFYNYKLCKEKFVLLCLK